MRGLPKFLKVGGSALVVALLALSVAAGTGVRASMPAQATVAATSATSSSGGAGGTSGTGSSAGAAMLPPCAPSTSSGSSSSSGAGSATAAATTATGAGGTSGTGSLGESSSGTHQPAYLGVQVTGISNCGVSIVQTDASSPAASKLQVGDIIVAVDCVPLMSWFTFTSSSSSSSNSSSSSSGSNTSGNAAATSCTAMLSPGAITGSGAPGSSNTSGAATAPDFSACTTIANNASTSGQSPDATTVALFACLVQAHNPGDNVIFTIQRSGQQQDVPIQVAALPAGGASSSSSGSSTGGSSSSAATPAATP